MAASNPFQWGPTLTTRAFVPPGAQRAPARLQFSLEMFGMGSSVVLKVGSQDQSISITKDHVRSAACWASPPPISKSETLGCEVQHSVFEQAQQQL